MSNFFFCDLAGSQVLRSHVSHELIFIEVASHYFLFLFFRKKKKIPRVSAPPLIVDVCIVPPSAVLIETKHSL